MQINSWPGLIAVILAIISFYGMTYVVIALNVGWRFGYWLASACFGALMVLLSFFWVVNIRPDQAVGPQGALPAWLPVAAATEVGQVEFKDNALTAPSQYPDGDWTPAEEGDTRVDAFNSSVSNCLSASETALEEMPEHEGTVCKAAQELMPADTAIPVIDGAAVAVVPKTVDVMFADDHGVLAAAEVHPVTTDVRVSKDPDGKQLADSFTIVAILDKGSVGLPSYMSLVIFLVYAGFHLWGLHRAEKRKLSPTVI